MHPSAYEWVKEVVARYQLADRPTLEVGAQDVNGSVRDLFIGPYLGIDRQPGKGVNEVHNIEDGPYGFAWSVVVSTEMLEHAARPWRAVANMAGCLKAGGHLIVTCRGFDERGAPPIHCQPDYWRPSAAGLEVCCFDAGLHIVELRKDPFEAGLFLLAEYNGP